MLAPERVLPDEPSAAPGPEDPGGASVAPRVFRVDAVAMRRAVDGETWRRFGAALGIAAVVYLGMLFAQARALGSAPDPVVGLLSLVVVLGALGYGTLARRRKLLALWASYRVELGPAGVLRTMSGLDPVTLRRGDVVRLTESPRGVSVHGAGPADVVFVPREIEAPAEVRRRLLAFGPLEPSSSSTFARAKGGVWTLVYAIAWGSVAYASSSVVRLVASVVLLAAVVLGFRAIAALVVLPAASRRRLRIGLAATTVAVVLPWALGLQVRTGRAPSRATAITPGADEGAAPPAGR